MNDKIILGLPKGSLNNVKRGNTHKLFVDAGYEVKGYEPGDESYEIEILNDDDIKQHELDGKSIMCTDYQYFLMQRAAEIRDQILEDNPVLTESTLKEMIENVMKKERYINGPLNEELGDLEINLKEELDKEYNRLMEERQRKLEELEQSESVEETAEEEVVEENSNE